MFGWLILEGVKPIENRHFACPLPPGSSLYIHVSKTKPDATDFGPLTVATMRNRGYTIADFLNLLEPMRGKVCGRVTVEGTSTSSKSPWASDGTHHWSLAKPEWFAEPWDAKGNTTMLNLTLPPGGARPRG